MESKPSTSINDDQFLVLLLIRVPFATGVTILRLLLSYATTLFRFSGSSPEELWFDRKLKMVDNSIF